MQLGGTAASQLELIIRETYCFIVVSKKIGIKTGI